MPPLDPASTAALVVQLAAMADDEQFVLEQAPTLFRYFQSPYPGRQFPGAAALAPQPGEEALLVAYAMLYRRQTFRGCIVASAATAPQAGGLLAQDALYQAQTYDRQHPFTEYTPGGNGTYAGP